MNEGHVFTGGWEGERGEKRKEKGREKGKEDGRKGN